MTNRFELIVLFLGLTLVARLTACTDSPNPLQQHGQDEGWRILVQAGGELYFLDLGSTSLRPIGLEPDNADHSHRSGSFDPTGTKVVFTQQWNSVALFDLATKQAETILKLPYIDDARWSHNRDEIALEGRSASDGKCDIYVYSLLNRKTTLVVDKQLERGYELFSWAPDGTEIVYEDSNSDIWIVNVKTRERRRLDHGRFPTWSPNGRYIAYRVTSEYPKLLGYIVFDLQTQHKQPILVGEDVLNALVWSPDSRYVIFSRLSRGVWGTLIGAEYWGDLYVLDLASGTQNRIYGHGGTIVPLDWSKRRL